MTYEPHDLQVTYDPSKGWSHFVLYTEPTRGIVMGGLNATTTIEPTSAYAHEWRNRLERCDPNPLHTTLVGNEEMPKLFHPCVYEDKESPSAVAGDGCLCRQTWVDPEFGSPVVAEHYRTVSGNIEHWKYRTYAPLDLRPGDTFASLIVDDGMQFWARTSHRLITPLPQESGHGYGVGYSGSGPRALAQYIQRLIESDGEDTAAGDRDSGSPDPNILAWASSKRTVRTLELSLNELRAIQHG
ncbi:hypothetical protein DSC45_34190 [Streptomyces sp. YIM 130001]|uniref:hypothetical protein n=1 Tax=Streptomyces sp. YIM 130001 TaxID=2259644 RepID=UPI000E65004E|nr:hypothetical protein [Streptomyces sp. YIM 130001]RII07967.1 hypothetical protein DSC45_34190 [Streptomyces sp. YIM 130001]